MPDGSVVEVIVRPRCRLWHRGRTYLPGQILALPDAEVDEFVSVHRRVVRYVTADSVRDVREAIAKRWPRERYTPTSEGGERGRRLRLTGEPIDLGPLAPPPGLV